jgi:predicted permease
MSRRDGTTFALRIYQRLADAFPHEFKVVYGDEMMQLGEDVVQEIAKEHGIAGLIRLIADIAIRVPVEYMSEIHRDLRYAARTLIKSPGYALVGILSLGLGMGVTTSIFSTLWAQMFRDLAGAVQAERLATQQKPESIYYIDQYRAQTSLFSGVAAFQNGVPFNVAFPGGGNVKPQRVFGQLVSLEYFSVLGVRPQRGRVFDPSVDKKGSAPVVVITDRFWRNRLNASPDALGQTLRLNGQSATIVGIGPKDFLGVLPVTPAEIFVPITVPATLAPELSGDVLQKRDAKEFLPLLRLAPGVTMDSAEAGVDALVRHLDAQDPSIPKSNDKGRRNTLLPGGKTSPMPRNVKPVLVGFYVTLLGLILTIACMNLANMSLARGAARRREVAIRLAVGASRFRLIRQMLIEGVLLSLLGGIAGFGLGYWLSLVGSQMKLPSAVPIEIDHVVDWQAAMFTFALAIVCGIGFSLAPALQATKADVASTLKEGAVVQLRGHRRFGMRNLLVVGQVAGSLMLLLITGFLVIGFSKTNNIQTRFDPATMCLLSVDPVRDGYTADQAQAFFDKLPEQLKAVGGVGSFALAAQPPFSVVAASSQLVAETDSKDSAPKVKTVAKEIIGPGYFAALNEPVLSGREFEERDQRATSDGSKTAPLPALLNEAAARELFGESHSHAVGRLVREDKQTYDVVGVVRNLTNGVLASQRTSLLYLPLTQRDFARPPGGLTIMARASGGTDAMLAIERQIASTDPNLAVFNVETLSDHLEKSRSFLRMGLEIYSGIGVFGLILAAIGLAGVTAYAVARRRREIGIRMALGARKVQVVRLVLREGIALVAVGTVLGLLGAAAMVRILSAIASIFVDAFNVATNDPRLVVGAPLLLAALAMIACYLPARRSAKIDPLKALREE